MTAVYVAAGAVLGEIGQKMLDSYIVFRSQVHRHYLQLHPERFPPPSKSLYLAITKYLGEVYFY